MNLASYSRLGSEYEIARYLSNQATWYQHRVSVDSTMRLEQWQSLPTKRRSFHQSGTAVYFLAVNSLSSHKQRETVHAQISAFIDNNIKKICQMYGGSKMVAAPHTSTSRTWKIPEFAANFVTACPRYAKGQLVDNFRHCHKRMSHKQSTALHGSDEKIIFYFVYVT